MRNTLKVKDWKKFYDIILEGQLTFEDWLYESKDVRPVRSLEKELLATNR